MKAIEKLSKIELIVLIIIAGAIVYFNSLFNGFVWDDEEQIVNNAVVHSLSNLPTVFRSSTFNSGGAGTMTGVFYKPLMPATFMLNYSVWKLNPFGYHLFQVLLHLINSVLIFLIFLLLFKSKTPALLASLIFVVHPANTESVDYIASTQEVLFTFFSLSTFLILLRSRHPLVDTVILGGLGLLGLLSKESAVVLFPIVFFYLILFKKEKVVWWTLLSCAVVGIYAFLRFYIAKIPLSGFALSPISEAGIGQRLMTVSWEIIYYLKAFFIPVRLAISQHTVIKNPADFEFWGYGIIVLGILGALAHSLRLRVKDFGESVESKLFAFFAIWFIVSIGLVLNLFPLDMTAADRWLYFPMIGLLGMGGVVIEKYRDRLGIWGMVGILGVVGIFGLRTVVRNTNWYDGYVLFAHDVKYSKNAFDLENNYGVELFRKGFYPEAKVHFEKSVELQPRWWTSNNNLGAAFEQAGDLVNAEKYYRRSILSSDYYLAYENLGSVLIRTQQKQASIVHLEKAVKIFPYNPKIISLLSVAYYLNGQQKEAETMAQKAYSMSPTEQNAAIYQTIISKKKIIMQ